MGARPQIFVFLHIYWTMCPCIVVHEYKAKSQRVIVKMGLDNRIENIPGILMTIEIFTYRHYPVYISEKSIHQSFFIQHRKEQLAW